ncbi:MAG: hypothetical protein ACC707_03140 [Thiohalomonadales bacterium]
MQFSSAAWRIKARVEWIRWYDSCRQANLP